MNPSFNLSNYTISFGKRVDKDSIFFEFHNNKKLIEMTLLGVFPAEPAILFVLELYACFKQLVADLV